ncbi:putative reverse transcriptase domain-containing protein [Tanacetum coccineum]
MDEAHALRYLVHPGADKTYHNLGDMYWQPRTVQKALGTRLDMSTAYHPQTDGQSERSKIALVKVRWNSKRGPEFTWERDDYMKSKYPQLFADHADSLAS